MSWIDEDTAARLFGSGWDTQVDDGRVVYSYTLELLAPSDMKAEPGYRWIMPGLALPMRAMVSLSAIPEDPSKRGVAETLSRYLDHEIVHAFYMVDCPDDHLDPDEETSVRFERAGAWARR